MTPSQILATAVNVLHGNGFQRVTSRSARALPTDLELFENPELILGIAVFDDWEQLVERWPALQGWLTDAISLSVNATEPKAWEGYLVLFCAAEADPAQEAVADTIRKDTSRLRKLVFTGRQLLSLSDVDRALWPVLPFTSLYSEISLTGALEQLPTILERHGIPRQLTESLMQASLRQRPLMEVLYDQGREQL